MGTILLNFQANTLYATDSYVVSLSINQNGTGFLSGHADGSIVRWYVADDTTARAQVRKKQQLVNTFSKNKYQANRSNRLRAKKMGIQIPGTLKPDFCYSTEMCKYYYYYFLNIPEY